MSKELDLSAVSSEERLRKITEEAKALGAEERMSITSVEDFSADIKKLLEENSGNFIWAPLSNGPSWEGVLLKNTSESLHESIVGYMSFDHRRCDGLYADAEAAFNDGNKELAAELLKAFDIGMKRHLGSEENILFPAFTEATGMVGGPVQVMMMEHDQMRGVMQQMTDAMGNNDLDTAFTAGDTMVILMQQHNVKEEGILYPMLEQHAPGGLRETVRNLQLYIPT